MNRRNFLAAGATAASLSLFESATGLRGSSQKDEPVRYPDPAIEIVDERFRKYPTMLAAVERLATGFRWAEGPVWFGDGRYLLFSDIPNNQILRWTEETGKVSVFRNPSNYANGNTRDLQGRLITCEHVGRRVTRTEYDGHITVLMDRFENKRLNAPNDAVIHPDGHLWFTDPGYGILSNYDGIRAEFELPTNIYRLNPGTGQATVVTDEILRPNGLCFSPDFKKLYVVDTGRSHKPDHPSHIRVFDVVDNRQLTSNRMFADMAPGGSDGIRCDADGNVWAAAGWGGEGYDGVHIFAPDGALIGKIHLPEVCANLCFGGEKGTRLFMTASQSLYSLFLEVPGASIW